MKIVHWTLYGFTLKLKNTIPVGGEQIRTRDGFILELAGGDGRKGYGEISPLPGWQSVNLAAIPFLFQRNSRELLQLSTNQEWPSTFGSGPEAACARFATECAQFSLQAENSGAAISVPLNALLRGENAVRQCRQKKKQGFTHFKLKIGRASIDKDIATIRAICQRLDESDKLRLDANRGLKYESVIEMWQNIPHSLIDYFEEPVADHQELAALINNTDIPIALDESVHAAEICDLDHLRGAKAVVLKPQIIGSVDRLRGLTESARKNNMSIIFSDTYSSGIGLRINALLNQHFERSPQPAGLDTYSYLAEDILRDRWKINNGRISFGADWPEMDFSHLTKVAEGEH